MATQRLRSRPEATSGGPDLSAPGDLASSAASDARYLRAANVAPATLKTYAEAVRTFTGFLAQHGMPTDVAVISPEHVEAFITDQLARWRPATAANRYRGLQRFFAWLVEEGEIKSSPMVRMKPPHVPDEPPAVLRDGGSPPAIGDVRARIELRGSARCRAHPGVRRYGRPQGRGYRASVPPDR